METPVSIIIPAYNQVEYCRMCVESVLAHTPQPHRLILVDNGSTDGAGAYFDSVPGAVAVHLPGNRGFAGGVNAGLAHAAGHVLLLNSDTIVTRGWLERLLRALDSADDAGLAGPVSNYVSGAQCVPGLNLTSHDAIHAFAEAWAAEHDGEIEETSRLVGFCLLIRDRTAAQLGLLDERFGIGCFEDDDYCMRAQSAGYRLVIARGAFVFHFGSRTFAGMGMDQAQWQALMTTNRQHFFNKWAAELGGRRAELDASHALNSQARTAFAAGRTAEALKLLAKAIGVFPQLELNYNDLGAVLWACGDKERAYEQFERALRLNPIFPEARANLRDAAEALGRLGEARTLLGETGPQAGGRQP